MNCQRVVAAVQVDLGVVTNLFTDADIVPPTSQNQPTIEHDLFHFVEDNLDLPDDELSRAAEVTIRNHDPCISCATHFLDLTIDRRTTDPSLSGGS